MSSDNVLKYINIIDKFNNGQGSMLTDNDQYIINLINRYRKQDPKFDDFMRRLNSTKDKMTVFNEYFNLNTEKEEVHEEELISKVFGIDINNIEHYKLNNDNEIFSFIDYKTGKKVVLQNSNKDMSLVEQLKQIQNSDKKYQESSDNKNTIDMLKENNSYLDFVPVKEVSNYVKTIEGFSLENYYRLLHLVNNAEKLGIVYINIENIIGMDSSNNILEVYIDNNYEFKIGKPNQEVYNNDNIQSNKYSEKTNSSELNTSNFDDNPNQKVTAQDEENKFDSLSEEEQKYAIMFYENPELLDKIDDINNRKKYASYAKMYEEKKAREKEQELEKTNNKVHKLILEKNEGYINHLNLTALIALMAVIIYLIVIFSIKW